MKSLYGRQFLLTAGMILISFALLGTSFIALTYRYTIQDTRNSMERNVDDVASFTGSTQEQGIGTQSKVYQIYIANIARIANAVVIIADSDGSLVLYADGSGDAIQDGLAVDHLPQSVMQTVLESGGYSGMSSLGGLFPERRFVSGTPIVVKSVDPFTGQTQHLHLLLHRRGGAVYLLHHQLHHLPAPDQPSERDRRGHPQVRPRGVRGPGAGL